MTVRAIDPPGCGCTDCLIGWSVPLDRASSTQVADMIARHLLNRTSTDMTITTTVTVTWEHLTWQISSTTHPAA
jgi:hypothetical protein